MLGTETLYFKYYTPPKNMGVSEAFFSCLRTEKAFWGMAFEGR